MRAPGGPRLLLRRLREVMAEPVTAQARLDRIVVLIASNMVAEVCSAYVMRAGEVLELFATEGLRPEAVHRTRLRVGEGLVGVIAATARPLALADAQAHPDFAYRKTSGRVSCRSGSQSLMTLMASSPSPIGASWPGPRSYLNRDHNQGFTIAYRHRFEISRWGLLPCVTSRLPRRCERHRDRDGLDGRSPQNALLCTLVLVDLGPAV